MKIFVQEPAVLHVSLMCDLYITLKYLVKNNLALNCNLIYYFGLFGFFLTFLIHAFLEKYIVLCSFKGTRHSQEKESKFWMNTYRY